MTPERRLQVQLAGGGLLLALASTILPLGEIQGRFSGSFVSRSPIGGVVGEVSPFDAHLALGSLRIPMWFSAALALLAFVLIASSDRALARGIALAAAVGSGVLFTFQFLLLAASERGEVGPGSLAAVAGSALLVQALHRLWSTAAAREREELRARYARHRHATEPDAGS